MNKHQLVKAPCDNTNKTERIKSISILFVCMFFLFLFVGCSAGSTIDNGVSTSNESATKASDTTEEDLSGYIEYDKEQLCFNEDIRWGMSSKELNDKITLNECYKTFKNAEDKNVHYYYWSYFHKTNTYYLDEQQYWLYEDTDKLNSYMLTFEDEGCTYENYIAIKKALIEKYGEPTNEKFDYSDETYKEEPATAFKYNYLTIKTSWVDNDNFDLVINWKSDMCTVTYSEKGYKGNY